MAQTLGQKLTCRTCKEEPLYDELTPSGICGDCDFWMEKWRMRNNPRVIRAKGVHYMVGPYQAKYKGYDGHYFLIRKDGELITTNNLWHQGEIPERFRAILPDNAEIL